MATNPRASTQSGQARVGGDGGLLQTIEATLDDIRTLINCRVCMRPLYEPYTTDCGHTFCYGCLVRWFEKKDVKTSCPECRCDVVRAPAPAYLVRNMTQIFSNRAELMPAGETTEEHQKWQQEEASLVEKDRQSQSGLFRGCFRRGTARAIRRALHDAEDGVERCPDCQWEVEDGMCDHCGWRSGSDNDFGSDVSEDFHRWFSGPGIEHHQNLGQVDWAEQAFGGHPHNQNHFHNNDRGPSSDLSIDSEDGPPYDSFLDDTDSSDGEDAASLNDFVVNDVEERARPEVTPSIRWSTGEDSGSGASSPMSIPDALWNHGMDSAEDHETDGFHENGSEDDLDEYPARRRPASRDTEPHTSSHDSSAETSESSVTATRTHNVQLRTQQARRNSQRLAHNQSFFQRRGSEEPLVEISSASESPLPMRSRRARRPCIHRVISSDEEEASENQTNGENDEAPRRSGRRAENQRIIISDGEDDDDVGGSGTARVSHRSPIATMPSNNRNAPPFSSLERSRNNPPVHEPRFPSQMTIVDGEAPSLDSYTARRSTVKRSRPTNSRTHENSRLAIPNLQNSASPFHGPGSRSSRSHIGAPGADEGVRDRAAQKSARKIERRRLKAERQRNLIGPSRAIAV